MATSEGAAGRASSVGVSQSGSGVSRSTRKMTFRGIAIKSTIAHLMCLRTESRSGHASTRLDPGVGSPSDARRQLVEDRTEQGGPMRRRSTGRGGRHTNRRASGTRRCCRTGQPFGSAGLSFLGAQDKESDISRTSPSILLTVSHSLGYLKSLVGWCLCPRKAVQAWGRLA